MSEQHLLVLETKAFDTKEMIEVLKAKLPHYMIPTQIKFVDAFPLNTNGKTDRKKLKELFE